MPHPVHPKNHYSPAKLELSYKNCDKLIEFLAQYRGPQNDNSGKYGVALKSVKNLFNETWKNISTSSGHIKLQHCITKIVVNYKNHDNDPVDAGAVSALAETVQEHVNTFFEKYLGYSTRVRHTTKPDFKAISKRLNHQG